MIAELYWANFLTAHEYLAASIDCASPMNASQPKVVVSRSRAGRLLQARTTKRKRMIKVRRCQNVSGRVNVNRFGHLKVNIRTCKSEHFSCVRTARSVAIKGRRPSALRAFTTSLAAVEARGAGEPGPFELRLCGPFPCRKVVAA